MAHNEQGFAFAAPQSLQIINQRPGSDAKPTVKCSGGYKNCKLLKFKNMGWYRKKPVAIQAIKWTGENLKEIISFTGLHPSAGKWTWEEYESVVKNEGLKIFTLEGPLMASIGDWIIQGVKGEFYPCKPDIFESTYEKVGERIDPLLDVSAMKD